MKKVAVSMVLAVLILSAFFIIRDIKTGNNKKPEFATQIKGIEDMPEFSVEILKQLIISKGCNNKDFIFKNIDSNSDGRYFFRQYYRGLEVCFSTIRIDTKKQTETVVGNLMATKYISKMKTLEPKITEKEVMDVAYKYATTIAVEDNGKTFYYHNIYRMEIKLGIFKDSEDGDKFKLAYIVPTDVENLYIDAMNGEFLYSVPTVDY